MLLALAAALAGCGGSTDSAAPPPPPATYASDPSRPAAPDIAGTTLDGDRASLADFRGRPVFVNVWASW